MLVTALVIVLAGLAVEAQAPAPLRTVGLLAHVDGATAATRAAANASRTIPIVTVSAHPVIAGVAASIDALLCGSDPVFFVGRQNLVEAAARHRIPAMWEFRGFAEAGGLMSCGASPGTLYRRAATYIDKLLKGSNPADLPIEQPTTFELVVNVKTAKALGLSLPQALLVRADQVIE